MTVERWDDDRLDRLAAATAENAAAIARNTTAIAENSAAIAAEFCWHC
jgi:hypothetical protein